MVAAMRTIASAKWTAHCLKSCNQVGNEPKLLGRPYVENVGKIEIGDRLRLNSRGVQSHLVTGPRGTLRIGNDVSIDLGVGIAAHAQITIGDRTRIGAFAIILDTDFHEVGNHDILPDGSAIHIGDDVRLGSQVTVLKGSCIGTGASILAGSVVAGDIPPGAVAGGVPARVLRAANDPTFGHTTELREEETAERVCRVVKTTFALSDEPERWTTPDEVVGWDSLGTLRLILALEDEFQITLDEHDLLGIQHVGALVTAVEARLESSSAGACVAN